MKKVLKKLLLAVLAAALTCTGLPIQGTGTTNLFSEEDITSDFQIAGNGVLTQYNGKGGDIVIPDRVTSIGDYVFWGCTSLTSVTIPEGVTSIGEAAFGYCSGLTSVTIPEGVTSIGHGAFDLCSNLTSITIPESVTNIGDYAFSSCSGLTSITIPESVTSIGRNVFGQTQAGIYFSTY